MKTNVPFSSEQLREIIRVMTRSIESGDQGNQEECIELAKALLGSDREMVCRCPLDAVSLTCPFSYSNCWHAQRDAMLLRTVITPEVAAQIEAARLKMTDEELETL